MTPQDSYAMLPAGIFGGILTLVVFATTVFKAMDVE